MSSAHWVGTLSASAAAFGSIWAWRTLREYSARRASKLRALARDDLTQLFLFVDPEQLARIMAWLLLGLAVVGLLLEWGLAFVCVMLACWLIAPRAALGWLARRRLQRLRRALPDTAAAFAAQLRAGCSLSQGLAALAAEPGSVLGQELALVLRRHRFGLPLDAALAELAERVRLPELALFVGALRIARELGGGLADALDRLAETLRRRRVLEDRIRALTAQGRMQGVIVSLLPPLVVGALAMIEPRATAALVTTPAGWGVVVVVLALQGAGWLLIRRIVDIDV